MKCQRQILHIHWSHTLVSISMSQTQKYPRTSLPPVMDFTRRRHLSVFGHIARLTQGGIPHAEASHVYVQDLAFVLCTWGLQHTTPYIAKSA